MIDQQEAINGLLSLDMQNPNIWEFHFLSDVVDLQTAGTGATQQVALPGGMAGITDKESFRVASVNIPFHHFESTTRKTGSKHYEGWDSEGAFSITFWETTDFKVFNTLETWKAQIYDPLTRTWGTGETRRNGFLSFGYNNFQTFGDNKFHENLNIYFYRIMLLGFDDFDLDYTKTDGMQIKANFIADRILPDHMPIQ